MVNHSFFKNYRSITALFAILLLASPSLFADLTATVDRNVLSEGEALVLTLRSDGSMVSRSPDLAPLEKDFDVLGTSQSNQIRLINGRNDSWIEWNITLMPTRIGTLTIPAITHKGEASNPITIEVRKASAQGAPASSPVFMRSSISAEKVWQGQEALLTLKIFTRAQFADNPDLTTPKAEGAIFKLLNNEQREERVIQGIRYQVITVEYLVTPTQAGILNIPGLVLTGAIAEDDPFGSRNFFRMTRSRPFRVSSPEMELTVNPPPAHWPAEKPWLPAKNVTIRESWSSGLSQLKAGDSITRTVTISADGTNSAQIPPLPPLNISGVNSYPDQPQTDDKIDQRGAIGTRSESVALVPTAAGNIIIPAVNVTWFNVESETIETSRLAAQTITIQPGTEPQVVIQSPEPQTGEADDTHKTPVMAAPPASLRYWQMATGLFALLWLVTLALLLKQRNQQPPARAQKHPTENPLSGDEGARFQKLLSACNNNDLSAIDQALLEWGHTISDQNIRSSGDVIQCLQHPELSNQWNRLQQSRYGRSSQAAEQTPNCSLLSSALQDARQQWLQRQTHKSVDAFSINP